jgi:hypothetical protein
MAWERRGRQTYYTRSRRVHGRVVREYVGRGPEGQLAAALDARRQQQREASRTARRLEREAWDAATGPLNELIKLSELFMRAALLAADFHQHERTWKKRRHHGVNGRD